jgi:uncharacterized membrane protein YqjE
MQRRYSMDKSKMVQYLNYAGCAMWAIGLLVVLVINLVDLLITDVHYLCTCASVLPLLLAAGLNGLAWLMSRNPGSG